MARKAGTGTGGSTRVAAKKAMKKYISNSAKDMAGKIRNLSNVGKRSQSVSGSRTSVGATRRRPSGGSTVKRIARLGRKANARAVAPRRRR
jgi:hypothetical protein